VWFESPSPVVSYSDVEKSKTPELILIFQVSPPVPRWTLPVVAVSVAVPMLGLERIVIVDQPV